MTAQNDQLAGPTAGARFDTGVREAVPLLVEGPVGDDSAARELASTWWYGILRRPR